LIGERVVVQGVNGRKAAEREMGSDEERKCGGRRRLSGRKVWVRCGGGLGHVRDGWLGAVAHHMVHI
jgi:hypothetical protein